MVEQQRGWWIMVFNCSVVPRAHFLSQLNVGPWHLYWGVSLTLLLVYPEFLCCLSHRSPPVFFCPFLVFSSHLARFLLRQHYSQMINNLENGSESGDGLISVEKKLLGSQMPWKGNDHRLLFPQIWANFIPDLDHCLVIQNLLSHCNTSAGSVVSLFHDQNLAM